MQRPESPKTPVLAGQSTIAWRALSPGVRVKRRDGLGLGDCGAQEPTSGVQAWGKGALGEHLPLDLAMAQREDHYVHPNTVL